MFENIHAYGVHSPWQYRLISDVLYLNPRYGYYAYAEIVKRWPKQFRVYKRLFRLLAHYNPTTIKADPEFWGLIRMALPNVSESEEPELQVTSHWPKDPVNHLLIYIGDSPSAPSWDGHWFRPKGLTLHIPAKILHQLSR